MLEYRTPGFNGFAVKYSPFFDDKIALASAANFGLVGNGRLYVLRLAPNGIHPEQWFETQDALFDLSWSETHENQVIVASGDGSIKLFDAAVNQYPVRAWKEHGREVFSVHWNLVNKDTFCSSSWDGTIKIWSPIQPVSLQTLPTHSCTYSASYSPHSAFILSSVSSDSHLRIFDLRMPASTSSQLKLSIPLHSTYQIPHNYPTQFPPAEALTHDWNKYRQSVIATAGVDCHIRTFDIRSPNQGALTTLSGHDYAVRKLAWSPHFSNILLTGSYDMTCRVWTDGPITEDKDNSSPANDLSRPLGGNRHGRQLGRMGRHTEFVVGVDWSLFGSPGWCATCAWDEKLFVWDTKLNLLQGWR